MIPNKQTGFRRLLNATGYSLAGLKSAWQNEAAFRQEIWAMVFLVPLAFWLGQNAVERALLLLTCFIVLIAELINSAIEAVVDRIGAEQHGLSGRAKDLGSAAVLVSIILLVVVWLLIGL
jgi:diacylglycerol kinase (ATP)